MDEKRKEESKCGNKDLTYHEHDPDVQWFLGVW